jgi:RHS repeat-associated protein
MLSTVWGSLRLNGATSLAYTYNNANRLVAIQSNGSPLASYAVSALGQRVSKTVSGVTTPFVYDEQGHLLGEYDASGNLIQETVWLEDLPVATLRPTGAQGNPTPINIYYVHADHLGSPRAVTRPIDNAIMWQWDNLDPFGANAANENPSGQGTFKYGVRFPGQYYDAETGTHYNYYRDYDPTIGRYEQSDPIGLGGGINTYSYVRGSPTTRFDREGLLVRQCTRPKSIFPELGPVCHEFIDHDGTDWGFTCRYPPCFGVPGRVAIGEEQAPFRNCRVVDCINEQWLVMDMLADYFNPPIYNFIGFNCHSWVEAKLKRAYDPGKCLTCPKD